MALKRNMEKNLFNFLKIWWYNQKPSFFIPSNYFCSSKSTHMLTKSLYFDWSFRNQKSWYAILFYSIIFIHEEIEPKFKRARSFIKNICVNSKSFALNYIAYDKLFIIVSWKLRLPKPGGQKDMNKLNKSKKFTFKN